MEIIHKIDYNIYLKMLEIKNSNLDYIFKIITNIMHPIIVCIILALIYFFLKNPLGKNKIEEKNNSINIKNILYILIPVFTAVFVFIIKNIVQRLRPEINNVDISGYSFPSGHSNMAFTIATLSMFLILQNNNLKIYIKHILIILIYILAVMIGFSRIYLTAHYFSDVLIGGIIGIIITIYCLIQINKKIINKEENGKK